MTTEERLTAIEERLERLEADSDDAPLTTEDVWKALAFVRNLLALPRLAQGVREEVSESTMTQKRLVLVIGGLMDLLPVEPGNCYRLRQERL